MSGCDEYLGMADAHHRNALRFHKKDRGLFPVFRGCFPCNGEPSSLSEIFELVRAVVRTL